MDEFEFLVLVAILGAIIFAAMKFSNRSSLPIAPHKKKNEGSKSLMIIGIEIIPISLHN